MKEILNNQYKNLFLWVPFLMAFGAALYFSCGTEPIFRFPVLISCLLAIIIYKKNNLILRGIALFFFGFFYAMAFTHIVDTPQIRNSFGEINISGTIKDIDYTTDKTRLTINIPIEQINQNDSNKNINIRVSLLDAPENISIGDTINGNAILFHPSSRYVPDSFDFARWAYFSNLSATGFFKDYEIIKTNHKSKHLRTYIHNTANSFLTDALVLGYKKTIPENESNIWKSIGVGHVWSISGFHMTLVGGWLFALFYLLFRLIPKITKRIPAKYPAMICAWIGLLFYLCISGISVATIRAFLMATLIGIATLFGRNVLSLRNGACAFLIIFLINPFYVMTAGFQLSFAAVFGLLWFYQNKEYIKRTKINKIFHWIYLSLMTALIATIFTLPFIIAHFGYLPVYSLLGNLIVLPIFSFAIMPLIVIGTILSLFGNYFIIGITHQVYEFALSIAKHITDLPYANIHMPHVSNTVLILSILGLLFLILTVKSDSKKCFIKNINYVLCAVFISGATIIYITRQKPLFYATGDHELVGFVVNNELQFNHAKMSKHYFAFDSWYEFNNEEIKPHNKRYKCNHGFCEYKTKNWNLVYMQNFMATFNSIENVCKDKNIDYIVSTFNITSPNCHGKILNDGLLIYPNGKTIKIINRRPWHNPRS